MTGKERFLAVQTYEEFDKLRGTFGHLNMADKEIREHAHKIFPKIKNRYDGELYTVFPDGSRMIGGPGMIAVKEKGYKSVEDYLRRSHEEWLKKQEQEQNENKK